MDRKEKGRRKGGKQKMRESNELGTILMVNGRYAQPIPNPMKGSVILLLL